MHASPKKTARPLRILEVVHAFPPASFSGTELYTFQLARALQRLGHDVTVLHPRIAPGAPPHQISDSEYEGVPVALLSKPRANSLPGMEYLDPSLDAPFRDFLRERRFDLVHFQHLIETSASWIGVAKDAGLPVALKLDDMFFLCLRTHLFDGAGNYCAGGPESLDKCARCAFGDDSRVDAETVGRRYGFLAHRRAYLRAALARVDLVHTPSRFLRELSLRFGFGNARFEVIPTGIAPFRSLPRRASESGRVRVGYLGALHPRKGTQDFLAAIRLHHARPDGGARLEFSLRGASADPSLQAEVEALAASSPAVHYFGVFRPPDLAEILSQLDLVVIPSRGENYPFVIREALAAGVPVASTRIAGIPEILRDGQNGFLFEPGDAKALAAIFARIEEDPATLARLRIDPSEIRTIDDEARELVGIFEELTGAGAPSAPDAPSLEQALQEGTRLVQQGHCEQARAVFAAARDAFEPSARLLLGEGVCAFRRGELDEAAELFSRAHALDPLDADVVVNWAHAAEKLGRLGELASVLEQSQAAHPDDADLRAFAELAPPSGRRAP